MCTRAADDEEGGGGGGGGGGAHRAEAELLGSTPLPSLAALEVKPDDAVTPAGAVQTMLEGMIVIQVGCLFRNDVGRTCVCGWSAGTGDGAQRRQAAGAAAAGGAARRCRRLRSPTRSLRPAARLQAKPGSRALSEGCVLVLEDRTPIGCIEEIFGPGRWWLWHAARHGNL